MTTTEETLHRLAAALVQTPPHEQVAYLQKLMKTVSNGVLKHMVSNGDEYAAVEVQHRAEKRTQRRAAR